ncbi:unnamed protein product [Didymodactylos carnosus]|uniref:ANK_REP_REGION domain-containing protein n=1 Tax=Didymodactylos carnosus TaxID=1234261 RepID=A0A8S2JPJ7_9BILA|nr:unnamed protein product [Didymodactylos carnosus]CAF3817346.1 unnamed protein product [Didymodactylos carnosus]
MNGANVNFQQTEKTKSTSLHVAAFRKHKDVVDFLLSNGANPSIRNVFGNTPSEDETTDEIRKLIATFEKNRIAEKNLQNHLFISNDHMSTEPNVKLQLEMTATILDVIQNIPTSILNNYPNGVQFSIARRPLNFPEDTELLDAVQKIRYIDGFLIYLPLCLVIHHADDLLPKVKMNPNIVPRGFVKVVDGDNKYEIMPLDEIKIIKLTKLEFEFLPNCVDEKLELRISFLKTANCVARGLKSCACMFLIQTKNDKKFRQTPMIRYISSSSNKRANLYVFNQRYWFTLNDNRMIQSNACYAIVEDSEIIPNELYLNPDMFLNGRLEPRDYPKKCLCLRIKERNGKDFSKTAYHGTSIQAVRSILTDGLVIPGTVTATGKRINPPANHIARERPAFNIPDFAGAIFVSPSVHYSCDSTYAIQFTFNDQLMVPVLEVGVRPNSYTKFPSTVTDYTLHDNDNPEELEWRINNPLDTEIFNVLFIPVMESITFARIERKKRIVE